MVDMNDLAAKIKALCDGYAAQLPSKFAQLTQVWHQLPRDTWDEEGFQTLHRLVHSLAGSGTTFGFPLLSDLARELENELKQIAQHKTPLSEAQHRHIESAIAELSQVSITQNAPPSSISVIVGNHAQANTRRVYIVEDEIELAESLKYQLSYFGYQTSVFNTLETFTQALQDHADVVIVMDISFPENQWGGIHVIQAIQKQRDVPLPVIFLSARDDFEARLGAVRAGSVAYFNKRFNVSSLIDKLDELTSTQPVVPYRVMIVDDSPQLTAYYVAVLEQAGIITLALNDPMAAMQPLFEFEPDLILIDMYMPNCNGMELAKVIRQFDAFMSIPIVFLSAEKDIDIQLEAMDLGGDDFLTKPIQPQHLVSAVSSRIRRSMLLRSLMVRDSLTGLLNHTAIKDQLDREVARAKRQATRCCFAMIDIDLFKQVNDTYGHPAGDRVIKSLSRLLKQRLREVDVVGRYGGEEFGVILVDVEGATVVKILNTIRCDFSKLRHLANNQEFSVSFSAGVADVINFSNATQIIDAADKALYQAKQHGRNLVLLTE